MIDCVISVSHRYSGDYSLVWFRLSIQTIILGKNTGRGVLSFVGVLYWNEPVLLGFQVFVPWISFFLVCHFKACWCLLTSFCQHGRRWLSLMCCTVDISNQNYVFPVWLAYSLCSHIASSNHPLCMSLCAVPNFLISRWACIMVDQIFLELSGQQSRKHGMKLANSFLWELIHVSFFRIRVILI